MTGYRGSMTTRVLKLYVGVAIKKLHQDQSVIVYVEIDGQLIKKNELVACYRCGSAGYFPEYSHVENGVCFRCRGARFENFINRNKRIFSVYSQGTNENFSI